MSDSRVNGVPDFTLEELDPPRALPSSLNVSSKLKDNIYDVSVSVGGETCQSETNIEIPKVSGQGHIALLTLENAYSDLHM